jgi:hypothetical protein
MLQRRAVQLGKDKVVQEGGDAHREVEHVDA